MNDLRTILLQQIEAHGVRPTARRLGVSPATISQIRNGNTGLSEKVRGLIVKVFGADEIVCPILGSIERKICMEKHSLAVKVGGRATGNPETLRLFRSCLDCRIWDGGNGGE
jgi:transcriptional regulator with XRE-family HTH domain